MASPETDIMKLKIVTYLALECALKSLWKVKKLVYKNEEFSTRVGTSKLILKKTKLE